MQAVVMRGFGDEHVLELAEVDPPRPGPGEALVRVGAVEVSRTRDIATRSGRHPYSRHLELPHILGGDFVGVVEELGPGVDAALLGARVVGGTAQPCGGCEACVAGRRDRCSRLSLLGIHRQGSYAELVAVQANTLTPIPHELSTAQAAALAADGPIALSQFEVAGVGVDTSLLITGATGALGTTLLALGQHFGARTLGLSRRPTVIPAEFSLTARLAADDPKLTERLLDAVGADGVDVVIDNVADGEVFERYFPAVGVGARIVCSGALADGGEPVLPVPARALYVKAISLIGVRAPSAESRRGFWDLVEHGFRLPAGLIHEVPLARVHEAHARIASGSHLGHTVLIVQDH